MFKPFAIAGWGILLVALTPTLAEEAKPAKKRRGGFTLIGDFGDSVLRVSRADDPTKSASGVVLATPLAVGGPYVVAPLDLVGEDKDAGKLKMEQVGQRVKIITLTLRNASARLLALQTQPGLTPVKLGPEQLPMGKTPVTALGFNAKGGMTMAGGFVLRTLAVPVGQTKVFGVSSKSPAVLIETDFTPDTVLVGSLLVDGEGRALGMKTNVPHAMGDPNRSYFVPIHAVLRELTQTVADDSAAGGPRPNNVIPKDHMLFRQKLGGAYVIHQQWYREQVRLMDQLKRLEDEVDEAIKADKPVDRANKAKQAETILEQLRSLRVKIENEKKSVEDAIVHRTTERGDFSLNPGQSLLVVADKIRIVGWDKPHGRCELTKTILDKQDLTDVKRAAHGKALRVVSIQHAGSDLDYPFSFLKPAQRSWLRETPLRSLWGRPALELRVEGLTHAQGNESLSIDLKGERGVLSSRSEWRRAAELTVYVPACQQIAVHGGLSGLDVESLVGGLVVAGAGDRDYDANYRIRGVKGDVHIADIPMQLVADVTGNVQIIQTTHGGNAGSRHANGNRTLFVGADNRLALRRIGGSLRAWFLKTELEIEGLAKEFSIHNEFGSTRVRGLTGQKLTGRIFTESGVIRLDLPKESVRSQPLLAATECGDIESEKEFAHLQDFIFTATGQTDYRRGWRCLHSEDAKLHSQLFLYPESIWDADRANRLIDLTLVSRAGRIRLGAINETADEK